MPYVWRVNSLRDRLTREKQLPVADSVRLATQVASALDGTAHRQGVVHRDIKPENVLMHDGQALVADFGIALAVRAAGGTRMTETGLSMGTPHYMSPEQASADRDLDGRSDLYALGVMLYEMLAGTPPFHGASAQSIVAKILTQPAPSVISERATVPPHVDAAIARALEKLPADRFDTADAFRLALDDETSLTRTARVTDVPESAAAVTQRTGAKALLPWATAALCALGAAASWLRPEPPALVQRYELNGADIFAGGGTALAISPDGSTIAYMGEDAQLYWRPISALEAQVVAGSAGSRSPFFSPDGRSIGYTIGPPASDEIRTISLDGAPPRTLAGDHFPGAAWGEDGFVYYADIEGALYRVSEQGGDPETLISPDSDYTIRTPDPLPGGRAVLVHAIGTGGATGAQQISILDLETLELTVLEEGSHPRFANGHLFWIKGGTLFAALFDVDALELTGQGMEVADGVRPSLQGSFEYAISEGGTLIYQSGAVQLAGGEATLGWVDMSGVIDIIDTPGASSFGDIDNISLSPDGRYVAIEAGDELSSANDQPMQIWIYDSDQFSATRLTFQGARNAQPRWMPDGRHVAYISSQVDGPDGIWMQPFDRTGTDELVVQTDWPVEAFDVAAVEGLPMILTDASGPTRDLWLAYPGTSEVEPFLVTDGTSASDLARWPVGRLRVRRVRPGRGVRPLISRGGTAVARLQEWRLPAHMEPLR